jgi:tetratricopeptide (TPR) repeat protein
MKIGIALKIVLLKSVLLFPVAGAALILPVFNRNPERIEELSQATQMVKTQSKQSSVAKERPSIMKQEMKQETDLEDLFKEKYVAMEEKEERKEGALEKISESDKGIFAKTNASFTLEEQATMDYHRAVEYFEKKDFIKAEAILLEVLKEAPRYYDARIALINFYLKEERLESAEMVLLEGLKLDESHPDFLRLMAMVHDRKGSPDKALALLIKVQGRYQQDRNYVAFLGYIYQQTGQYALARQQYLRLLEGEPKNSLWLLGITVALDAEGQLDAALKGYQRLVAEGNIDQNILEYVQKRIDVLKG